MREQLIDQGNQLEELLTEDFIYIRQDGQELDKEAYKAEKELTSAIKELHPNIHKSEDKTHPLSDW